MYLEWKTVIIRQAEKYFSISYMFNTKSDHFSPKIKRTFMEIGNQMQYHKIGTNSELIYEDESIWLTLI